MFTHVYHTEGTRFNAGSSQGEKAGGAATDGTQRILDIEPAKLHQRTPLYLGSAGDVAEASRRLR